MRANTLLLFLCLCLHAACSNASSSSSQTGPTPPAGTGSVVTNLDGTWVISDVERIDGSGMPLPLETGFVAAFLPVAFGQEIEFAADQAVDWAGMPLHFDRTVVTQIPATYINAADDSVWLFVVDALGICTRTYISAAFGTVDEHTLEGTVDVGIMRLGCVSSSWIVPDPNGTFRVVLTRAPLPASSPERRPSSFGIEAAGSNTSMTEERPRAAAESTDR